MKAGIPGMVSSWRPAGAKAAVGLGGGKERLESRLARRGLPFRGILWRESFNSSLVREPGD
jgi:hypothetical protein